MSPEEELALLRYVREEFIGLQKTMCAVLAQFPDRRVVIPQSSELEVDERMVLCTRRDPVTGDRELWVHCAGSDPQPGS